MKITYRVAGTPSGPYFLAHDGSIMVTQDVEDLTVNGQPYVPPPAPAPQRWECEVAMWAPDNPRCGPPWAKDVEPGPGSAIGSRARVTLCFTDGRAWVKPTKRDLELAQWLRETAKMREREQRKSLNDPRDWQWILEAADRLDPEGMEGA